ncbi:MAG: NnrS family protein [Synechococcaceae cyanobacterium SM1_2_3]|nr:NnrS family protein [Synechococcaceae cyanobacterium SM1_2_3]
METAGDPRFQLWRNRRCNLEHDGSRLAGHTGRDVKSPSVAVTIALVALIVGSIVRVGLPLIAPNQYLIWILISQTLWIAAFLIFLFTYAAILIKPRIDGQFG